VLSHRLRQASKVWIKFFGRVELSKVADFIEKIESMIDEDADLYFEHDEKGREKVILLLRC